MKLLCLGMICSVVLFAPSGRELSGACKKDSPIEQIKKLKGSVKVSHDENGEKSLDVNLGETEVRNADLRAVAGLGNVRALYLAGTRITDDGLRLIARL